MRTADPQIFLIHTHFGLLIGPPFRARERSLEFEPLLIESKNAATVVLMLQSPELEVILKACEAIYRYAEKGDENKAILAELGALEPISRLIKHEDKPVRRSAVMVLGVISAQNDVKKYLRKMNVIPSVIELLEPEEDVVIHEFASLCLSFLSSEPAVKVQILNEDGLEPLIALLSSPDPDVKKNSLETIYNLVQDFYSRAVICELNGIAPLLELLNSDYPVIQQLTLKTLATITSDVETRMALRELEGLDYLIEILGTNDLSDLHVDALLVISNCLEDEDTMQLIQQTGALDKLMQFARTATLVDVQRKSVNAILRAAQNSKNKKILHDHGVEKILVGLLGPDNAEIRETACLAITVMCENESSKVSFGKCDVIKPLVQLLQNDCGEVKEAAALALSSLTTANMNNSIAVYKARGTEPLVQLLANEREGVVAHVAAVLTNMSSQNILRSNIQAKGVMAALVDPLQSASSLVQSKAALAVSAFACDSEAREEFRIAGGLVALVRLLNSNINEVRRSACWAVFVCASDEPTCLEMFRLGALEILQEINLSTCRKNNFSEAALQKLFEGNLSIKYSLYDCLSSSDIIVDGFYDPGRVKPGKKVLPLEDLFKMEVNQQRPIILVNGRTGDDDLVESVSGDEKLVDGGEWTTGRSVSKDKSPSKTKGKGKEDEDEDDDRKTWLPPFDADFYSLVNEVTKLISPLENTRDRVVELAIFVAETMGGGVERRKLHNFYWELHLSELKYELKSNVIPIGKIKKGFFCHRALLFKALADRVGINCSLVRGEYNRSWNVVTLTEEHPKVLLVPYVVDLMHNPGCLMKRSMLHIRETLDGPRNCRENAVQWRIMEGDAFGPFPSFQISPFIPTCTPTEDSGTDKQTRLLWLPLREQKMPDFQYLFADVCCIPSVGKILNRKCKRAIPKKVKQQSGLILMWVTTIAKLNSSDFRSLTRYDESVVTTDWQKKLTPEQYYVTREKGTELWCLLEPYGSGDVPLCLLRRTSLQVRFILPVRRSDAKYNSGTGWPSFYEADGSCNGDESNANIVRRPDNSLGSTGTEVICRQNILESIQIAVIKTEAARFVKIQICVLLQTLVHDCTPTSAHMKFERTPVVESERGVLMSTLVTDGGGPFLSRRIGGADVHRTIPPSPERLRAAPLGCCGSTDFAEHAGSWSSLQPCCVPWGPPGGDAEAYIGFPPHLRVPMSPLKCSIKEEEDEDEEEWTVKRKDGVALCFGA
ncbi:ARMC3 protein, partial [Polypterus senegalus]